MRVDRLKVVRIGFAAVVASALGIVVAAEPNAKKPPAAGADLYGDSLPPLAALRLGTLRFHDEYVQAAAFSPDGRMLATAAMNFGQRNALWEVPSGRMLRRLKVGDPAAAWNYAVAFSPDGKTLATGDVNGALHVWDVATGDEIYSIAAHGRFFFGASAVAFSSDGQWIASGGGDGVVRVWNAESGGELLSFDMLPKPQEPPPGAGGFMGGPPGSIAAVAFSPDGRFLAAGLAQRPFRSKMNKIRLWDLESNKSVRGIDETDGELQSLSFTPDGKQLVSGGSLTMPREKLGKPYPALNVRVAQFRVWDVDSGKMVRELLKDEREAGYGAAALSKDGGVLAVGLENKVVVCDFHSGKIQRSIDVPDWYSDRGLALSPDGEFVCAPLGAALGVWRTATGESLSPNAETHTSPIGSVAYAKSGEFIATGAETLRIWDASTGRQRWSRPMGAHGGVAALAISPDGALVAAGGASEHGEDAVRIWQSATGDEVLYLPMFERQFYSRRVSTLLFSPDGGSLAIIRQRPKGSSEYDADLYDVKTGKRKLDIVSGFSNGVHAMAFSRDGNSLCTLDRESSVVGRESLVWSRRANAGGSSRRSRRPPSRCPRGRMAERKSLGSLRRRSRPK